MADRFEGGVDAAIDAVPASLRNNPGLAFDRIRWRRQSGLNNGARALLLAVDQEPANARAWWHERGYQAREAIDEREFTLAYRLASTHKQPRGFAFAEAEWLAGWLALRFLDRPEAASRHFQTLHAGVSTPVSRARAAYWTGRALDRLGDGAGAVRWFEFATGHPTTFYGQLAADRLGLPTVPRLAAPPPPTAAARQDFDAQPTVQATKILWATGRDDTAELFLRRLVADAETAQQHRLLGLLARDRNPRMAVRNAKIALRGGVILAETGYPRPALPPGLPGAEPALVFGLIRQESEFDADAISRANALGLMQLLPATARQVAEGLGVPHNQARLLRDPAHNMLLGSTYLAQRIDRFRGSLVLALAGYNAGSTRAALWTQNFGDPRTMTPEGVVDWIETLPFAETRNYIQRVLENTQVYRVLLGAEPRTGGLSRDLTVGRP